MLVAVEEDVYTTGQAARILGVTDRSVRKMIDRGELEAYTDDRGRREDLEETRGAWWRRLFGQ